MKTKTPLFRTYLQGTIVFLILLIPFVILFYQNPVQREAFTIEDGIIENLSAIFYFMASMVCLIIFYQFRSEAKSYLFNSRRNYFFLLLGLLMFFCFGEEISWGQRIFGIASTEYLKEINMQGETNIHNLNFFDAYNKHHLLKTGLDQWMTTAGLFLLFWFGFCFFIPIVNRISSSVHDFTGKISLPIIPIWIGVLFLINQIFSITFIAFRVFSHHDISEIKETNFAFLYLLACISLYVMNRKDQILAQHQ